MGNQITKKVSFQDVQYAQTNDRILIINTLLKDYVYLKNLGSNFILNANLEEYKKIKEN